MKRLVSPFISQFILFICNEKNELEKGKSLEISTCNIIGIQNLLNTSNRNMFLFSYLISVYKQWVLNCIVLPLEEIKILF